MKIETWGDSWGWNAVDGESYCCPECRSPVGQGQTEQAAITDLMERMKERES